MESVNNLSLEQTLTVGQALLAGVVMGIYYDLFRIIRRIFVCSYATIIAQDLFFWVTSAVGMFYFCIWCTGGILRVIFVLAALIGWGIYAATVGAALMAVVEVGVVFCKAVLHKILNWYHEASKKFTEKQGKRRKLEKTSKKLVKNA